MGEPDELELAADESGVRLEGSINQNCPECGGQCRWLDVSSHEEASLDYEPPFPELPENPNPDPDNEGEDLELDEDYQIVTDESEIDVEFLRTEKKIDYYKINCKAVVERSAMTCHGKEIPSLTERRTFEFTVEFTTKDFEDC
jgi:hypothetical protein